jgi:4-hydroxy-2-oxoheptanedioate aldolase
MPTDEIVVMAMIETKEGLANLDAICATPGLDAVYIGPADLSFALGLAAARRQPGPAPYRHLRQDPGGGAQGRHQVRHALRQRGVRVGRVKRGFDMVMLTSDLSCMIAGARMQLDEFKAKRA